MKCLIFAVFLLFFSSCQSKDPHPELADDIYKDLVSELEISSKALEAEEKNLLSLIKEKEAAIPQTGQIKYAQKKINDSQAQIDGLKQQRQFFEIKIELRKQIAQSRYEESLKPGGRPWPDPAEVQDYRATIKLQRDKLNWGKKKDVPRGTDKKPDAPAPAAGH